MIIIPDFMRYTEFTLEERLMLSYLAEARVNNVMKFLAAKSRQKQLALQQGDEAEMNACYARLNELLHIIGEIDQAVIDIYAEHGRLN